MKSTLLACTEQGYCECPLRGPSDFSFSGNTIFCFVCTFVLFLPASASDVTSTFFQFPPSNCKKREHLWGKRVQSFELYKENKNKLWSNACGMGQNYPQEPKTLAFQGRYRLYKIEKRLGALSNLSDCGFSISQGADFKSDITNLNFSVLTPFHLLRQRDFFYYFALDNPFFFPYPFWDLAARSLFLLEISSFLI